MSVTLCATSSLAFAAAVAAFTVSYLTGMLLWVIGVSTSREVNKRAIASLREERGLDLLGRKVNEHLTGRICKLYLLFTKKVYWDPLM